MKRLLVRIVIGLMLVIGWSGSAAADWKLDIGYTEVADRAWGPTPHRGRRQGDAGRSLRW